MNIDKIFKATEERITLHGLGFLQLVLQGDERLHVWHPALPRRKCYLDSAIHSHRFGFVSMVLIGTQINHNMDVCEPDERAGLPTHITYLHEGERTKFGNRPWIPDQLVICVETREEVVKAGQQYEMRAYDYHWTEPGGNGKVATIMRKTYEGRDGAHSVCKIETPPDVDFDRKQWTQKQLWDIVEDVLLGQ